jgi:predicted kinase
MVGIPGAGKSAFAERFSKTFQAPLINQTAIQKSLGVTSEISSKVALLMLDELLKTNRTLIYEGPTNTKVRRAALIKHVVNAGYQPMIVWVQTESVEAKRRATKKQTNDSQMTSEAFDAAIKRFSPPSAQEEALVISGKHTYASQLKIVLKRLVGEGRPMTEPDQPRVRSSRNIILR